MVPLTVGRLDSDLLLVARQVVRVVARWGWWRGRCSVIQVELDVEPVRQEGWTNRPGPPTV